MYYYGDEEILVCSWCDEQNFQVVKYVSEVGLDLII
jgi:hypothetical protein